MELKETVIGSETIFRGKIVTLRVDRVQMSDGSESKREIVEHKGAVCIVPVRDDGMVLMTRQFRLAAGKPLLEVPAGTLEEGEAPEMCATRELEEETGYKAGSLRALFMAYVSPGYDTKQIRGYLATGLTPGKTHTDADENVEVVPIPLADVERMVLSGEIEDSKTISALLMALRLLSPPT